MYYGFFIILIIKLHILVNAIKVIILIFKLVGEVMKNSLKKSLILFIIFQSIFYNKAYGLENCDKKYMIFIDTNEFTLYVIDCNTKTTYKKYPVALGKKDTPSPLGTWKITSKALKEDVFGGYWLGLNAPWGTFGIHGTNRPDSIGSLSSNGCIRMYNYHIKELFYLVDYNTTVIVYGGPNWFFSYYSRDINRNDSGADVYEVQRLLKALGHYSGPVNGIYDYPLELAVTKYKKLYNLGEGSVIDKNFFNSIGLYRFE